MKTRVNRGKNTMVVFIPQKPRRESSLPNHEKSKLPSTEVTLARALVFSGLRILDITRDL